MGTYLGGLFSMIFVAGMVYRFTNLWIMMDNGQIDNIQQMEVSN